MVDVPYVAPALTLTAVARVNVGATSTTIMEPSLGPRVRHVSDGAGVVLVQEAPQDAPQAGRCQSQRCVAMEWVGS